MGALLNKRKKRKLENFLFPVIAIILGISMAMPFVFMIIASLKPQAMIMEEPLKLDLANIFWGNYEAVFQHKYFFRWYLNSIAVVAAVLICRGFIVTLAAYAFARLEFRFKNVIFMMVLSMMMIPSDTTLIGRYLFFKGIHLIDTPFVVILPAIFDVFTLFLMRQFFMQIPGDLTEAALIDGCSHFRIYWQIILPLSKPSLLTMGLFTFIWNWNDYTNPFIFINSQQKQLLTVGLQYFQQQGGASTAIQLAGATMAILPPVLLFAFAQKYFIQGIASSGIKG